MPDQITALGSDVWDTEMPTEAEIPQMIADIARIWAHLHEMDCELALELARKLPLMTIYRRRLADYEPTE